MNVVCDNRSHIVDVARFYGMPAGITKINMSVFVVAIIVPCIVVIS